MYAGQPNFEKCTAHIKGVARIFTIHCSQHTISNLEKKVFFGRFSWNDKTNWGHSKYYVECEVNIPDPCLFSV